MCIRDSSYGAKIDVWSLGCILAELWTGDVLFENTSIQYLLAKVNTFVGPYPETMLQGALHTDKYFTPDHSTIFETDEESGEVSNINIRQTTLKEQLGTNDEEFVSFIEWCLTIDQEKRPTAEAVSYTHLRAHETVLDLVCRLLLEKKKKKKIEEEEQS
eukprot:TRINITY_DN11698_c0_g1_i4.p1 TRINITY_DN11698_c0_g1~~TRINITY_DN11698_c0_g1_i4.p1  ORF type:complete len:159 (+),score=49.01 TRINITY_DN11698_c0_g1_i4:128-604(+)